MERPTDLPLRDREEDGRYNAPRLHLSLADFDIIRRIGEGSFAQVVHVRHKRTGKDFALKIVDKHLVVRYKQVERIRRERTLLDQLDYQGVIKLYFTFQDANSLYMGLELCENGELYDQIDRKGKLPLDQALVYAAEMVLILEYLKSQEVIHRDLKPENLLLDANGHLKLIDFGCAKWLAEPGHHGGAHGDPGPPSPSQTPVTHFPPPCMRSGDDDEDSAPPPCPPVDPGDVSAAAVAAGELTDGAGETAAAADPGEGAGRGAPGRDGDTSGAAGDGAHRAGGFGVLGDAGDVQGSAGLGEEGDAGSNDVSERDSEELPQGEAGLRGGHRRAASFVGTAEYVAPEVLCNESVSYSLDLWSLGCIIYQMLAGKPPFRGASEYLTFQAVSAGQYAIPDDMPPHAADLVRKLLVVSPAQRLGAGPNGMADLKAHPFFEGVEWEKVRSGRAPAFLPPLPRNPDEEALDWELTSLMASIPQQRPPYEDEGPHASPKPPSPPLSPVVNGHGDLHRSPWADGGGTRVRGIGAGLSGGGSPSAAAAGGGDGLSAEAVQAEAVASAVAAVLLQEGGLNWGR